MERRLNNFNFQIARADTLINEAIKDLPVGAAYLILKNKILEIEPLYQLQAQQQFEEYQKQQETVQEEN